MHTTITPTAVASHPLFMLGSVDDLRRKLTHPDAPLGPWWRHLCALAKHESPVARSRHGVAGPDAFAPYAVLAGVVTGEAVYLDRVRDAFLAIVASHRAIETGSVAQFHTHITAAVLARWAVYYDWVADLGLFSDGEKQGIAHTLTDLAYVFPMQQLEARAKGFDNQVLNNALGAGAVGYVFGVRRADESGGGALARRMLDLGLGWLRDLFNDLPRGGYGCEGSTYQQVVIQSVIAWSTLLIEAITGEDAFDRRPTPDAATPRDILEMSLKMIGPDGLLPAWDDYGYQPAVVKAPLALLARRTGTAAPLAVIHDADMWYRPVQAAWMLDDRLWTLVWWPDDVGDLPNATYRSWMSESVGGALQGGPARLRLFQYWDTCGAIAQAGRPHVDPNNITLQAFDSPILLDGKVAAHTCPVDLPTDAVRAYVGDDAVASIAAYLMSASVCVCARAAFASSAAYLRSAWQAHPESWASEPTLDDAVKYAVMGCIGQANALIVDGEGWYIPRHRCTGRGEALHDIGVLKVIRSDATEFYTDRYDVTEVTRSSVVIADRYVVSADHFLARTPHALTWQAYVRHGAVLREDGGVKVHTAEQVRCDIVPLQDGEVRLVDVEGYPVDLAEGHSTRIEHRPPAAAEQRIAVALLPQPTVEPVSDITDRWTCMYPSGEMTCSLNDAYLHDDGAQPQQPRVFRRRFDLRCGADRSARRTLLRLPAISRDTVIELNGQVVAPAITQPAFGDAGKAGRLASFVDITDALRDGSNALVITAPYDRGQTVRGPVTIHRDIEQMPTHARRTGDARFAVTLGDSTDDVLVDNRAGRVEFAGGQTDARYAAHLSDGSLHVADAMCIDGCAGVTMHSDRPCDVSIAPGALALAPGEVGNRIMLTGPGLTLNVECGACIDITCNASAECSLTLHTATGKPFFLNGVSVHPTAIGHDCVCVALWPSDDVVPHGDAASLDALYAVVRRGGTAAEQAVLDALRSDDWRMQLAAADLAGAYRLAAAVDDLLALFTASQAELPYPDIAVGDAEDQPGAVEAVDEIAVKRWRVRRACVTALGRLGDQRAAPPLEHALCHIDDFFPVTSQIPIALGRLGAPSSSAMLRRFVDHAEVNTRRNIRHALDLLEGRIDRDTFERRVAVG